MAPALERSAGEFVPTTAAELARFVEENARGARQPLSPVGGRTALQFGYPLPPGTLSVATGGLSRVVDYPARDMTITVEAGLRVEELQQLLKAERQRVPVDVAQAHRATIGGAIATNTSGPSRFAHGTFRDCVIGISAVDGRGRLFSAGGRVVKNVAGYDLCKLLVGSLGTLAVVTQVTLRLRPLPETRRLWWSTFRNLPAIDVVLEKLLTSETRPTAVEVLNAKAAWQIRSEVQRPLPADRPVLCVAFEGNPAEIRWQIDTLRRELATHGALEQQVVEDAAAESLWQSLVEYQAASDDPLTFQATLPPSRLTDLLSLASDADVALQAHAADGIVIGHFPDSCTRLEDAASCVSTLRAQAERDGGALVIWSCEQSWKERLDVFGRARPQQRVADGIRAALDPCGLLNPGLLGRER